VSKTYIARVLGRPAQDKFTISVPIKSDPRIRPYQVVDFEDGKESITECEVVDPSSKKGKLYEEIFPSSLVKFYDTESGVTTSTSSSGIGFSCIVELHPVSGRLGNI
jgi:hypothetical protein